MNPVVYVELTEWPGYRIGSDRSIWSRYVTTGRGMVLSDPPVWRRKRVTPLRRGRPVVSLFRNGREYHRSVERLHRQAFPPAAPPVPLSARGMYGQVFRGEAHGRHKLTADQVVEARRLRREGWTLRQLAARFGVSPGTMGYATRTDGCGTWSHLPAD